MKIFKFSLFLLLLLLFATTSCQTSPFFKTSPEYDSGRKLADVYAKKDAMDLNCGFHSRWMGVMSKNLREHLEDLETEKTEDFLSGFSAGYQTYYPEYVDTYCGD